MYSKLSELQIGDYFRFANKQNVYHVINIIYSGDRYGNFKLFYRSNDSSNNTIYEWSTQQFDGNIFIYQN